MLRSSAATSATIALANTDANRLQAIYTINSMLAQIAAGHEASKLLPLVLRATANALQAERASLFITDKHLMVQESWFLSGKGLPRSGNKDFALSLMANGLVGHVVRTRQSIIVADTTADDRWLAQEGDAASEAAWSVIGVPLAVMTEGVTFGAMLVSRPGIAQYQEEDVSLLNSVAGQLASTLGLNHLHAENVQHAQEIAAFMEAMAGIASTFEVETIYSLITQHLVNLTRLELGVLLTWDGQKGMLANRLGYKHGRGQTTQLLNLTTSHLLSRPCPSPPLPATTSQPHQ
jgi:signal transduction protein with GAF and PtsI domain